MTQDEMSDDIGQGRSGEDSHPTLEDVHRVADGDYDAVADEQLISHVADCATCQAELELARRGAAIIALASRAPDVQIDRLRARRSAGDRVLLPVPNAATVADPAAATAAAQRAIAPRIRRRAPYAWAYGIAAVLIAAVAIRVAWVPAGQAPNSAPTRLANNDSARVSSAAPAPGLAVPRGDTPPDTTSTPADTALAIRAAVDLPGSATGSVDRARRWTATRAAIERVQIASTGMTVVRVASRTLRVGLADVAFNDTALSDVAARAVRELGVVLAERPDYEIAVRLRADSSASDSASVRRGAARVSAVIDGLVAGGVPRRQIRRATTVSEPTGAIVAIEVRAPND